MDSGIAIHIDLIPEQILTLNETLCKIALFKKFTCSCRYMHFSRLSVSCLFKIHLLGSVPVLLEQSSLIQCLCFKELLFVDFRLGSSRCSGRKFVCIVCTYDHCTRIYTSHMQTYSLAISICQYLKHLTYKICPSNTSQLWSYCHIL